MKKFIEKEISRWVSGKSFLDIGPLWETVNEKVSVAYHAGAKTLTAIDQFPVDDPLWAAFHKRMNDCGVGGYTSFSCNVLDYDDKSFDVVNCGGVIYHAADPINLLKKIRTMTNERLILTSTVTPDVISNEFGDFSLPDGSVVFVPALSAKNKQILSKHWSMFLRGRTDGGLIHDCTWDVENYHHWWWLFTPAVLQAMCVSCGFVVETVFVKDDLCTLSMKC